MKHLVICLRNQDEWVEIAIRAYDTEGGEVIHGWVPIRHHDFVYETDQSIGAQRQIKEVIELIGPDEIWIDFKPSLLPHLLEGFSWKRVQDAIPAYNKHTEECAIMAARAVMTELV
jgi:hypothetical protein